MALPCFDAVICNGNKDSCRDFLLLLQCGQEEAFQNVASKKQDNGCSDSKNIQIERDKNPLGLLLIAVGKAAGSIKAGGVS